MSIHRKVLAISMEADSKVSASMLRDGKLNKDLDQVAFHAITFDERLSLALADLLGHKKREWKSVEFINCRGQVKQALAMAMTIDCVESLHLVRNIEGFDGYSTLGTMLESTSTLKKLRLTSAVKEVDAIALAAGLAANTSLEMVEFRWSTLEDFSMIRLREGFFANTSLRSIDFFGCNMDDESVGQLASALSSHPTLKSLLLNGNSCGNSGARELAKLIENDRVSTLRKLDISFQRSGCGGKLNIEAITDALATNTTLESLDLTCSGLDDEDAERLALALVQNTHLKEIFLARNKFSDAGIKSIARHLPNMMGLRKLSLWGNPFDEEAAEALMHGMQYNMELYDMHLFRKFKVSDEILNYTNLNRGGRKLLGDSVALSIWPKVLDRVNIMPMPPRRKPEENHKARIDMLFCLLQGPALLSRGFQPAASNREDSA
eukprot:Nitzschia sp. Nitz4//scaffold19_size178191//44674//45978//NITZ4_001963-RA/size178191-processed-gene-0.52-mRNA-1//-1//CDS//3329540637//8384//frame0